MVHLRLAANKFPQQRRKTRPFLHHVEPRARRRDRAVDLHAVAHDAGVLHQPLDSLRAIARDLRGLKAVEGAAEILALAQDGDPRQSGLEAIEHELLIKRAVVALRYAPLFVVIGDIERILPRPGATGEAIGMQQRGHASYSAAFAPLGHSNRAQSGLTGVSAMPPDISGLPVASASAARSRRSRANPRPLPRTEEPMTPTATSPASTGTPTSAAKSLNTTGMTRLRAVPRCSTRETTSWPM